MKQTMYESPEIFYEDMPAENGFLGSGDTGESQLSDFNEVSTDWD